MLHEKVWIGLKPYLRHFRRFGCSAFVHVTQDKTCPRTVKGVFMGYSFGIKGYRVLLPDERRCTTNRNVVFNKNEVYKNTLNNAYGGIEESDIEEKKLKKARKRIYFSHDLISGPSSGYSDLETTFSQGGETSESIENSKNSESPESSF